MRSFIFVVSVMAIFAMGAPLEASATWNVCNNQWFEGECPEEEGDGGNSNVNTANGGDAEVGNGFGNFSPSATAFGAQGQIGIVAPDITVSPKQRQRQGQEQGQGQGQGQEQEANIGNGFKNFSSDSDQGQGQFGYVDSHDLYEAQDRDPVSSAAPVSATACSSGISAQGVDLGGAVATTNVYCNLALVAEVAAAQGKSEIAAEMVELMAELARADAQGVGGFRTHVRKFPVLGSSLFRWMF